MDTLEIYKKFNIEQLPINPVKFITGDIKLFTYEQFLNYTTMSYEQVLEISKDGFTTYKKGSYIIAYNKKIGSIGRRRFTIMHELCHIFLGHIGEGNCILTRDPKKRSKQEKEADTLAIELLSPLVVLHFCGVCSVSDIRKLCDISNEAAVYQYQKLTDKRADLSGFNAQREKETLMHFSNFISKHITKKVNNSNSDRAINYLKKAMIFADDIEY